MILDLLFIAGTAAAIAGVLLAVALVGFAQKAAATSGLFRLFEQLATACVWVGGFIAIYTAPLVLIGVLVDLS